MTLRKHPVDGFRSHCVVGLTVACAGLLPACDATGAAVPAVSSPAPETAQIRTPARGAQDSWLYVIDEPGVHFNRAHGELKRRQRSEAASDVRKAAAMIDIEATRARGADRTRLRRDASELLGTAGEIESGRLADTKRLDFAVAVARADLAIHYDMKAAEAWIRHDRSDAGRSLAAAARHVSGALISLDQKIPAHVADALQQVERLGDRLADRGEGVTESAWTEAREALGRALRHMGQKVESDRAAPPDAPGEGPR
jgi:hypothetical protein